MNRSGGGAGDDAGSGAHSRGNLAAHEQVVWFRA